MPPSLGVYFFKNSSKISVELYFCANISPPSGAGGRGGGRLAGTFVLRLDIRTLSVLLLPEPGFVNLLRSPGIDSQPGGPVRQPCLTYRPARLHRLAE